MQYIPAAAWRFCHSFLRGRLAVAADHRALSAVLLTSGLLPSHPHLALLALNSLLRSLSPRAGPRSHPRPHLALLLLRLLLRRGHLPSAAAVPGPRLPLFPPPDHLSYPFAISAAAAVSAAAGDHLHALVVKNSLFPSDHYVGTALLQLYSPTPDRAHKLFEEIPRKDPVHYDLLLTAYLRAGRPNDALDVFKSMLLANAAPDAFVLTSALTACAHAGALDYGAWIHRYIEQNVSEFLMDSFIGSALVSMYAKCGCVDRAVGVFERMPERNTHVWATMVGAFAVHGMAREAVGCLERMAREDGARPDGIVILGVLSACAHAGLVEDGLMLLSGMEERFGVVPEHDHYSCAVDMLCRVGRLDDAMGIVRRMPMRPLASVWGSVLTGCRIYGHVELAEVAAAELQRLAELGTADDEGIYVQLSNIYLDANRKDDARRVRKLIGSRGIKKVTACSAIEVGGEVSSFVAGDQAHPLRFEIWRVLKLLADQMGRKSEEEEDEEEVAFDVFA